MKLGTGIAKSFLASTKSTEILCGLGDDVVVEGEFNTAGLVYNEISKSSKDASLQAPRWQRR